MKKDVEETWVALVFEHQQKVLRVAFAYTKNWHDAEEIAQEVFVKLIRKQSQFRGQSSFFTWVYRITVNHCHDFLRKKKRRPWLWLWKPKDDGAQDPLENLPSTQDVREALDQREMGAALDAEIGALPEKQRAAFTLFYLEGLSLEEVADILQVAVGSVKAHLFQARQKLKPKLEPFWKREREEVLS